jgi:hypothetical protein
MSQEKKGVELVWFVSSIRMGKVPLLPSFPLQKSDQRYTGCLGANVQLITSGLLLRDIPGPSSSQ